MNKLKSGAWPEGSVIELKSTIHQIIASLNIPIRNEDLTFRPMTAEDLPQFKALMAEWFPFEYSDYFYDQAFTSTNYSFLACSWTPPNQSKSYIIAGILIRFETDSRAFNYVTDKEITTKISCCTRLINYLKNWNNENAYISTIGVIDEARRLGIASRLLDIAYEKAKKKKNCVSISLHVLTTNQQAIRCYEKNGFVHVCNVKNYYTIQGKTYDARYYVKKVRDKDNYEEIEGLILQD